MQIDMPAHSALCSIFGGFYGYGVVWQEMTWLLPERVWELCVDVDGVSLETGIILR